MGSGPARKPTRVVTNPPLGGLIWRKRCPGCSRHVSLKSGRAKRDLCREICLMLKLQMETDSDQLLMERTESLGDDSHEQWVKLEKQQFDDWAGNCWIRKGA